MNNYIIVKDNYVTTVAVGDENFVFPGHTVLTASNYGPVSNGFYYDSGTDSFTPPLKFYQTNLSNTGSNITVYGDYVTASYDASGSVISTGSISSSSIKLTFTQNINTLSNTDLSIKNATIKNLITSGNEATFDLTPGLNLGTDTSGSIEIILEKTIETSTSQTLSSIDKNFIYLHYFNTVTSSIE